MIADSIEDGIKTKEILWKDEALARIDAAVKASEWVSDQQNWAICTLLFSQHACKAFVSRLTPIGISRDVNHLIHNPHDLPIVHQEDAFPFSCFAHSAMYADVGALVEKLPEWEALPQSRQEWLNANAGKFVPHGAETGRWSSANPPKTNISSKIRNADLDSEEKLDENHP
jgi:hypothetical protein